MRTTLSIDDDVLAAARERARRERRTVGAVISDLARASLTGTTAAEPTVGATGFVPFPRRGPLVSNELIDRLRDEEGA